MSARGSTMLVSETLVVEICCSCGVMFAMPNELKEQLLRSRTNGKGKEFFCPNGHRQWYTGKTDAQLLQEKLDREKENSRWWREQQEAERRAHAATKGKLTKERHKAAAALCPVEGCRRKFVQLERHLKVKHPGYHPEHA